MQSALWKLHRQQRTDELAEDPTQPCVDACLGSMVVSAQLLWQIKDGLIACHDNHLLVIVQCAAVNPSADMFRSCSGSHASDKA